VSEKHRLVTEIEYYRARVDELTVVQEELQRLNEKEMRNARSELTKRDRELRELREALAKVRRPPLAPLFEEVRAAYAGELFAGLALNRHTVGCRSRGAAPARGPG